MKRIYVSTFIVSILSCVLALSLQGQALSESGRGHFYAGLSLFEMARSIEDYEGVAKEFETVTKTDPNFADSYINLCKIYGRLGVEKGGDYFTKARQALEVFHKLKPDDPGYSDELILLNALTNKRKERVKQLFLGKWEGWFCDMTITSSGEKYHCDLKQRNRKKDYYVVSITPQNDHLVLCINEVEDNIANGDLERGHWYVTTVPEYENKTKKIEWTKQIDHDTYLLWEESGKVYMSLYKSSTDYYYNNQLTGRKPEWLTEHWKVAPWCFPLTKID